MLPAQKGRTRVTDKSGVQAEKPKDVWFRTDTCVRAALDRFNSHTNPCQAHHEAPNLPQVSANNLLRRVKSITSRAPRNGARMDEIP